MWPSASGEPGFSLLEVLVALLLLSLAVVPAIEALGGGLRGRTRLDAHLEAVTLAEARMNALALLPPDSLAGYTSIRQGAFEPPFQRYGWRALVRPMPGEPRLLHAAVLVEWPEGDFAVETFFYDPDQLPRGLR